MGMEEEGSGFGVTGMGSKEAEDASEGRRRKQTQERGGGCFK